MENTVETLQEKTVRFLNEIKDMGDWSGKGPIKVGMYVSVEISQRGQGDVPAQVIKIQGDTYTCEYKDTDGSGDKIKPKFHRRELTAYTD